MAFPTTDIPFDLTSSCEEIDDPDGTFLWVFGLSVLPFVFTGSHFLGAFPPFGAAKPLTGGIVPHPLSDEPLLALDFESAASALA